jgi:epoxyqueuosine reductase QueG
MQRQQIIESAKRHGAAIVGIASVDRWEPAPVYARPTTILKDAQSVVVFGVPIPRGAVETIPSHIWTRLHGHLMGVMVDDIAWKLALELEAEGYKSVDIGGLVVGKSIFNKMVTALGGVPYPIHDFETEGELALNWAGQVAGLGRVGTNSLLLTPQFGPNVILGAVITTAKLEPDPMIEEDLCDECGGCVKDCPAGAMGEDRSFDMVKCFLMNAAEGRLLSKAMAAGDTAVQENLSKTIIGWTEHTPATCICGAGCLAACPQDPRRKALKKVRV